MMKFSFDDKDVAESYEVSADDEDDGLKNELTRSACLSRFTIHEPISDGSFSHGLKERASVEGPSAATQAFDSM